MDKYSIKPYLLTEEEREQLNRDIIAEMDESELIEKVIQLSLAPMIANIASITLDYCIPDKTLLNLETISRRFRIGAKIFKVDVNITED